ncbi:MAG: RNA-binding protein [Chitinispirillaceae bacterium]|nr:RNA-binding protein [Chitinispirillaceae bacterium]
MAQKLYIGNLSFNATEEGLRTLFSQYGEVTSVSLVTDRDTGRPRGFGFVEMENAEAAIAALNEKEFEGRVMKVDIARERAPRGDRGGFNRGGGGNFHGGKRFGNKNYRQDRSW